MKYNASFSKLRTTFTSKHNCYVDDGKSAAGRKNTKNKKTRLNSTVTYFIIQGTALFPYLCFSLSASTQATKGEKEIPR